MRVYLIVRNSSIDRLSWLIVPDVDNIVRVYHRHERKEEYLSTKDWNEILPRDELIDEFHAKTIRKRR